MDSLGKHSGVPHLSPPPKTGQHLLHQAEKMSITYTRRVRGRSRLSL